MLEHFGEAMPKSDACLLRKLTVELARYPAHCFAIQFGMVAIATIQVVLNLYQTFIYNE